MKREDAPIITVCVAVLVLVTVLAFFVGKGCPHSIPTPVETGIDAGPGERVIASTLDGATQHASEQLAAIEREHADALAQFNETQQRKYDVVRRRGPDAVSDFLVAFNATLRDAGP